MLMEKNSTSFLCQLYHYNEDAFLMTKNTTAFYAANFAKHELNDHQVHWLNFHTIEDRDSIEKLCETLNINRLSVEDVYKNEKRPKLEEYQDYLFFSIKSALPVTNEFSTLQQERISFVIGKNYLISFQEKSSDHFTDVRDRIEKKRGKIRSKGSDFLLFRMLDAITDNYFEVLEEIVESIERIEKRLIRDAKSDTLKSIEIQKRKLIELRKIVFPLKDITNQLEKMNSPFLEEENRYYFSELKDNCLTVLEEIDANKQILEGLANLYYAVQGQRMNEIMKLLTVVSAIFIPLTFIAGIYGMNFENIPELKLKNGYFIAWGVMIIIAVVLLIYFKRRGWLKR